VSKYEHGVRRLDLMELDSICSILGTNLAQFVRRYKSQVEDGATKPRR
jgi:hypothetical protein